MKRFIDCHNCEYARYRWEEGVDCACPDNFTEEKNYYSLRQDVTVIDHQKYMLGCPLMKEKEIKEKDIKMGKKNLGQIKKDAQDVFKRKELSSDELNDLSATVDNEGFWYAVTDGGYIDPEDVLSKEKDIEKVRLAIKTLREFESLIPLL